MAVIGVRELLAAEVFVSDTPRSGRTALIDDVVALFENDSEFVPMRSPEGVVRLYGKSALACIAMRRRMTSVAATNEEHSEVFTLYDREHKVEVELVGGLRLEGVLMDSSPSTRSRAVDHLNRQINR